MASLAHLFELVYILNCHSDNPKYILYFQCLGSWLLFASLLKDLHLGVDLICPYKSYVLCLDLLVLSSNDVPYGASNWILIHLFHSYSIITTQTCLPEFDLFNCLGNQYIIFEHSLYIASPKVHIKHTYYMTTCYTYLNVLISIFFPLTLHKKSVPMTSMELTKRITYAWKLSYIQFILHSIAF